MNEAPLHRLPLSFVRFLPSHFNPHSPLSSLSLHQRRRWLHHLLDDLNLQSSPFSSPTPPVSPPSPSSPASSTSSVPPPMATSASGHHHAPTATAAAAISLHGPDPPPYRGQIHLPTGATPPSLHHPPMATYASPPAPAKNPRSSLSTLKKLFHAHGGLGIGPVSSMVLVGKDAILADGHGTILYLKLDKKSDQDSEFGGSHPPSVLEEGSSDGQGSFPSCPMEEKEEGGQTKVSKKKDVFEVLKMVEAARMVFGWMGGSYIIDGTF